VVEHLVKADVPKHALHPLGRSDEKKHNVPKQASAQGPNSGEKGHGAYDRVFDIARCHQARFLSNKILILAKTSLFFTISKET
jgi:hypothetical protein